MQAISFMIEKGILYEYENRVVDIKNEACNQNWVNRSEFEAVVERFDY